MLIIRLQRTGKKNSPDFRVVLAEKKSSASKKFTEILGSYNPRTKVLAVKDQDRLKLWISKGVEISPTVHNLLVTKNLLDAKKVRAFNTPKKPVEPAPAAEAPKAEVSAEAPAAESAKVEEAAAPAQEEPATVEKPAEKEAPVPEQPTA